ncbi:hypothetical protein HON86_00540 [Candidatus Woesearchaeota archaeon]|mgnify:FL=1|jgi:hypothetical protein|nr:hypothetical protein [Candidatus Woesearchaeota archaeon]MBT4835094.1 hypothetical protein [Candidatus Woesearchaeota archaeon]MBT6734780.1 hypothetical protein [Candidatus Woesearchaeota archaeon]MBT7170037.1 hypothetical protein [Candidatus Woesearchaeota archaeon]MBT7474868.1 hypothetical protein [Candidatus Woesearchaeota archaeon]
MICLLSLIVFGILAIFSASYRPLAKEAFDCVFRRMTLRKCQSGLDVKVKSKIVGRLIGKSTKLAKGVHKYFEVISWFFVILFFVSLFFSGQALYNVIVYDNCNGISEGDEVPGYCIITGEGGGDVVDEEIVSCEDPQCADGICEECGTECECGDCSDP